MRIFVGMVLTILLMMPTQATEFYVVSGGVTEQDLVYAGFRQRKATVHGYHFAAGYNVSPYLAGELGYTMLDDYTEVNLDGKQTLRLLATMVEVAGLARLPFGRATPYLRLAYADTDMTVDANFGARDYYTDKTHRLIWGVGVDLALTETSALRLDYTDGVDETLGRVMLGLTTKIDF